MSQSRTHDVSRRAVEHSDNDQALEASHATEGTDALTQDGASQSSTRDKSSERHGRERSNVSRPTWQESKRLKTNDAGREEKAERKPKRKVACLIGYCGTGFHGMQLNPPNKTIESTLFEAFVKTGAVSADNADDPKKVSFLRAARTDKGVHAAVNVISLKMIIEDDALVERINMQLPDQIRVWKIMRTMKSFNPRTSCDSRIYEYLLPTSAFLPPRPGSIFADKIVESNSGCILSDSASQFWEKLESSVSLLRSSEQYTSIKDDDSDVGPLALDHTIPEVEKAAANAKLRRDKLIKQHIIIAKRDYRISAGRLHFIKEALAVFKGTKNFHNYTVGQTYQQPNSKRVIRSFEIGTPFLIKNTEWVSLKVHGQSFMLHQIRKMVAMVLLVIRTSSTLARMENSFGPHKLNIPKAPSLGLLLERPIFNVYNTRAGDMTDKENIELGDMNDVVHDFKMTHVYDKIYTEEETENTFDIFLNSLDAYGSNGNFDYLFSDVVPDNKHQKDNNVGMDFDLFKEDGANLGSVEIEE